MNIQIYWTLFFKIIVMELSVLAKNLLFLRKRNKFTQAEMPDRCDVKGTTWSNWENGVAEPSISKLIDISNLFGLPIDFILKYDLEKNVHLIEKWETENNKENVHLNVHPNVLTKEDRVLNEPDTQYDNALKKEVDILILKQLNSLSDDVKRLTTKLLP